MDICICAADMKASAGRQRARRDAERSQLLQGPAGPPPPGRRLNWGALGQAYPVPCRYRRPLLRLPTGCAQALKPQRTSLPHPTSVTDGCGGLSQPGLGRPPGLPAQACRASMKPRQSRRDAAPLGGGGRDGPGSMAVARTPRAEAIRACRALEGGLRTQAGSAASLGHRTAQIRFPGDHSVTIGRDLPSPDDNGQRP
nr:uncharacterized protein LOC102135697 [Macaca fascicularis]